MSCCKADAEPPVQQLFIDSRSALSCIFDLQSRSSTLVWRSGGDFSVLCSTLNLCRCEPYLELMVTVCAFLQHRSRADALHDSTAVCED